MFCKLWSTRPGKTTNKKIPFKFFELNSVLFKGKYFWKPVPICHHRKVTVKYLRMLGLILAKHLTFIQNDVKCLHNACVKI